MSRFDSDQDYADWRDGPYDRLTCADCGAEAVEGTGTLCEACLDHRDAHTSRLELRAMATAVLSADLTRIKDVA